ncbi:hypothetical protein WME73_30620 [Sorangium sp. So ce302]|uniref:type II toxin-antitoxin system prevent-host-death family antitoxin n=1 Tax=unclassified Sorangium TaxID=2621164 RepID=UPI003F5FAEE5
MANAIRIRTQVTSELLHIPELSALAGKNVEVIILEEESAPRSLTPPARKLGALRGLFDVPDDFDDPLPEDMLHAFEGDGET